MITGLRKGPLLKLIIVNTLAADMEFPEEPDSINLVKYSLIQVFSMV